MIQVLKNPIRQHIFGHFRGKDVVFRSKNSKEFDMDNEEQKAEYYYWRETFDFVYDVTPKEGEAK